MDEDYSIPDGYQTLYDAIEETGRALYPDEWTGQERGNSGLSKKEISRNKLIIANLPSHLFIVSTVAYRGRDEQKEDWKNNKTAAYKARLRGILVRLFAKKLTQLPAHKPGDPNIETWLEATRSLDVFEMQKEVLAADTRRTSAERQCQQALWSADPDNPPKCASYIIDQKGLLKDFAPEQWATNRGIKLLQSPPGYSQGMSDFPNLPLVKIGELSTSVLKMREMEQPSGGKIVTHSNTENAKTPLHEIMDAKSKNQTQLEYDPMREATWSLPMVAAWVVWRTPDAVRFEWDEFTGMKDKPNRQASIALLAAKIEIGAVNEGPANCSLETAIRDIWRDLSKGEITATGLAPNSTRAKIAAINWTDLVIDYSHDGADILRMENNVTQVAFTKILFQPDEIIDRWAADLAADKGTTSRVDNINKAKSWLQGQVDDGPPKQLKPYYIKFMVNEFDITPTTAGRLVWVEITSPKNALEKGWGRQGRLKKDDARLEN